MDVVKLNQILGDVHAEFVRAASKHAPMNSHHEAYAVIREEFEVEYFQQEVCRGGSESGPRREDGLRRELVHTAAMCVRALHDLC